MHIPYRENKNLTGTADVTIKTRPYPSGNQTSHGSFDVTTSTTKVNTRIRGRQVAVRISSEYQSTMKPKTSIRKHRKFNNKKYDPRKTKHKLRQD